VKLEIKHYNCSLEIKAVEDSEDKKFGFFEGYASTFSNIDKTDDIINKGAFAESIVGNKPSNIKMFWNHSSNYLIGSYTELKEDDRGLFVKGRINLGTQKGKEAYELLKAGDLDKMSIGFRIKEASYDTESEVRTILKLDLFEISLVPIPANDLAEVMDVKSLDEVKTIKDIEAVLKSKGFSINGSKTIISKIKEITIQRDVEESKKQRDAETTKNLIKEMQKLTKSIINSNK